jgi:hypothetical protein
LVWFWLKNTCGRVLVGNPAEAYFSSHSYL